MSNMEMLEKSYFEGMKRESSILSQASLQYKKATDEYEQGHFEEAYQAFAEAAAKGYAKANYMLAEMTLQGQWTEKNETEALALFRAAALLGDGKAQAKLGYFFKNGLLVEKDEKIAATYYERAIIESRVSGSFDEADQKEYEELRAAGWSAIDFRTLHLEESRDSLENESERDQQWEVTVAKPYGSIVDQMVEKCELEAREKFGSTLKAWQMEDHKGNSFGLLKELIFQACMYDLDWIKTLSDLEILEILQFLYETSNENPYLAGDAGEKESISLGGKPYLLEDVLVWEGRKYGLLLEQDKVFPNVEIALLVDGEWRHMDRHGEIFSQVLHDILEIRRIDAAPVWWEIDQAIALENGKSSMAEEEYEAAEEVIRDGSRIARWYARPCADAIMDYKTKNERHIMVNLYGGGEVKEKGLPKMITPFNHSRIIDMAEADGQQFWILSCPRNIFGKVKAKPEIYYISYAKDRPLKAKKPIIDKVCKCKTVEGLPENVRTRFALKILSCKMQGGVFA